MKFKQTPQIMFTLTPEKSLVTYDQIKGATYQDELKRFDKMVITAEEIEFIRSSKSAGAGEVFINTRGQETPIEVKLVEIDGSTCLYITGDNVHIFIPYRIFDRGIEFEVVTNAI